MHRMIKMSAPVALLTLIVGVFASSASGESVAGRYGTSSASYLVQVDPNLDVQTTLDHALAPLGGHVDQVFAHAIHGAVVTLPVDATGALAAVPGIQTIEPNGTVHTTDTQTAPPWGLDRSDQRDRPLDQRYSYTSTGTGVDAYIIDTGIRITHHDVAGRAISGFDAVDGGKADDCHGHGTHVSGTTGGTTYGMAKQVHLIAVRVLDCLGTGTDAQVISGIDWAISDHAAGEPAVANMSLGGGASQALDTAVKNLYADGVTVVVAAGNDTADACGTSPARVPEAITVAATDQDDAMASFSNGGTCIDIFAPGISITSAWNTSDSSTNTISGTSMSAPHVTGTAARYLEANPGASPGAVTTGLVANASQGKVSGTGRTCRVVILLCRPSTPANRLLYVAPIS